MNIKFFPKDQTFPPEKRIGTNIGEFSPGESRSLLPDQEKEGRRLIENGDFVEVPDAPEPKREQTEGPKAEGEPKKSRK